jgi:hypothetical protein
MLFALAARRAEITAEDLAAAVDLWRYCRASAEAIFGQVHDKLFHRVVDAIRESPGITRSKLHARLGWKLGSAQLVETLARVRAAGLATAEHEQTGGRPTERWRPVWQEGLQEKQEKPPADPFPTFSCHPSASVPVTTLAKSEQAVTSTEPAPVWNPDTLRPGTYTL